MTSSEFISDYLEPLLNKISFEKKEAILLGDFNINLLNCDSDKNTCDFLEHMLSFSFLPRIIKPTCITPRSQTLIDNIFYAELDKNILAGNITTDISDHLTQFVAIPVQGPLSTEKNDIYKRNYKNFNSEKFKEDFNKINWKNLFSNASVDNAYDSLPEEAHKLIDKHFPLKNYQKEN